MVCAFRRALLLAFIFGILGLSMVCLVLPGLHDDTCLEPTWVNGTAFVYKSNGTQEQVRLVFSGSRDGGWRITQSNSTVEVLDNRFSTNETEFWTLQPPITYTAFPLRVGKEWTQTGVMTSKIGPSPRFAINFTGRVLRTQTIHIPMGTFRCWVVNTSMDVSWGAEGYTLVRTLWYSPKVGYFVRQLIYVGKGAVGETPEAVELQLESKTLNHGRLTSA